MLTSRYGFSIYTYFRYIFTLNKFLLLFHLLSWQVTSQRMTSSHPSWCPVYSSYGTCFILDTCSSNAMLPRFHLRNSKALNLWTAYFSSFQVHERYLTLISVQAAGTLILELRRLNLLTVQWWARYLMPCPAQWSTVCWLITARHHVKLLFSLDNAYWGWLYSQTQMNSPPTCTYHAKVLFLPLCLSLSEICVKLCHAL